MLEQYNMSIHISTSTAQVLVEQRKKNGVVTRKNISYQSLVECFLTSRVDDERHETGLLPEGCIAVAMEKKFTYYFIRYPELCADFRYFDTLIQSIGTSPFRAWYSASSICRTPARLPDAASA